MHIHHTLDLPHRLRPWNPQPLVVATGPLRGGASPRTGAPILGRPAAARRFERVAAPTFTRRPMLGRLPG